MKKLLMITAVLFFTTSAYAQEYNPFKVGIHLGYAAPDGGGGGGVAFALEPGYRVTDEILVGLRIEGAVMVRGIDSDEASASAAASYTLTGQYYLGSGSDFRPFVGAGLGLFETAGAAVSAGGNSVEAGGGTSFGFHPRVGFDYNHFNFLIDYNLIGKTDGVSVAGSTVSTEGVKNSYFTVKIGVSIGGGKN